jgi:hypothetical protein
MKTTLQAIAVESFVPMLRSLSNVLDKGAQHAKAKNFDVAALVTSRLAPDMYTLQQQVQLACYQASDATARLTRQESTHPTFVDETLGELQTRIHRTIDALQKTPAASFDGAEERAIVIPLPGGDMAFEMNGLQFVRDWALPHFYFHIVTAYDILRHGGVDIGKRDYVGNVGRYIRPLETADD